MFDAAMPQGVGVQLTEQPQQQVVRVDRLCAHLGCQTVEGRRRRWTFAQVAPAGGGVTRQRELIDMFELQVELDVQGLGVGGPDGGQVVLYLNTQRLTPGLERPAAEGARLGGHGRTGSSSEG